MFCNQFGSDWSLCELVLCLSIVCLFVCLVSLTDYKQSSSGVETSQTQQSWYVNNPCLNSLWFVFAKLLSLIKKKIGNPIGLGSWFVLYWLWTRSNQIISMNVNYGKGIVTLCMSCGTSKISALGCFISVTATVGNIWWGYIFKFSPMSSSSSGTSWVQNTHWVRV